MSLTTLKESNLTCLPEEFIEQMAKMMEVISLKDQQLDEARNKTEQAREKFKKEIEESISDLLNKNLLIEKNIIVLKNQIGALQSDHQTKMQGFVSRVEAYEREQEIFQQQAKEIDARNLALNNEAKAVHDSYETRKKEQEEKEKAYLKLIEEARMTLTFL